MKRDPTVPRVRALVLVTSLLAMGESAAQSLSDLHPGTWGGSLEADFGVEHDRTHSPDGTADIESRSRRSRELLTIKNEGFYFIDPLVANGNLALTFGLIQDRQTGSGTEFSSNTKLVGYNFDANLFSSLPYNLALYANRTENRVYAPFSRTDLAVESRGTTFRLREDSPLREHGFPYFSANVTVEQQHVRENTTGVLGQSFNSDELRNVFRADGHKGFETADLDLRYEFDSVHNSLLSNGTFQTQTANLDYSADFGPTLNRNSRTRLFMTTRSGLTPITVLNAEENLRLEHQDNLSTGYRYQLGRTDTDAGTTTTRNEGFDLRHVLYRNLTTTVQLTGSQQDIPTGTLDRNAAQLGFQYQRNLPWNGRVFANANGLVAVNTNNLTASQIHVTDEAQSAPSPLGAGAGFTLNQPFVIASSIVVVNARVGLGRPIINPVNNYDVVQVGNLTRIVPLATSAEIQPGDPLEVSYDFNVDPTIKYRTTSHALSAGVDFQWIALSFGHEASDQTLLSGQDRGFLQDTRRDNAQLDLRGNWQTVQAQAGAGFVHYDSTRLAYNEQRYSQFASYRPYRNLTLSVRGDETNTDFKVPEHRTETRSAQLTLDWYAPWGWTATGLVARRTFKDTLEPTETINEASLKARFQYGLLDMTATFTVSDRNRGGFDTSLWRFDLAAVRRF